MNNQLNLTRKWTQFQSDSITSIRKTFCVKYLLIFNTVIAPKQEKWDQTWYDHISILSKCLIHFQNLSADFDQTDIELSIKNYLKNKLLNQRISFGIVHENTHILVSIKFSQSSDFNETKINSTQMFFKY